MWTTFRSVPSDNRVRRLSRVAPLLLCTAAALYSAQASAESSVPLELTWNVPEGCPTSDTVRARIRQIAGSSRPTGAPLRAEATVTRQSDRAFRLRLTIQSGDLAAERVIEG